MGFQHGAELQQQQQMKEQMRREGAMGPKGQLKTRIRDVWRGNLAHEMVLLREMILKYPYISMVRPTFPAGFVPVFTVAGLNERL